MSVPAHFVSRSVYASTGKYGVSENDALHSPACMVDEGYLSDGNIVRRSILGLTPEEHCWTLVLLVFDIGNELVIHTMPACMQAVPETTYGMIPDTAEHQSR